MYGERMELVELRELTEFVELTEPATVEPEPASAPAGLDTKPGRRAGRFSLLRAGRADLRIACGAKLLPIVVRYAAPWHLVSNPITNRCSPM